MDRSQHSLKLSLIACSIPGAIIVLVATVGAWLQWGGLSFGNPIYYAILAVAAWCPVSKMVAWRFWRREVKTCLVCVPAKSMGHHLSTTVNAGGKLIPGQHIIEE